jgi:hypothetical protein
MNNLAAVHQARDNPALAEPTYRSALLILRQSLEPWQPPLVAAARNIARLRQIQARSQSCPK